MISHPKEGTPSSKFGSEKDRYNQETTRKRKSLISKILACGGYKGNMYQRAVMLLVERVGVITMPVMLLGEIGIRRMVMLLVVGIITTPVAKSQIMRVRPGGRVLNIEDHLEISNIDPTPDLDQGFNCVIWLLTKKGVVMGMGDLMRVG